MCYFTHQCQTNHTGAWSKKKNSSDFIFFLNVHILIIIFALILNYCLQILFIKIEGTLLAKPVSAGKEKAI